MHGFATATNTGTREFPQPPTRREFRARRECSTFLLLLATEMIVNVQAFGVCVC